MGENERGEARNIDVEAEITERKINSDINLGNHHPRTNIIEISKAVEREITDGHGDSGAI